MVTTPIGLPGTVMGMTGNGFAVGRLMPLAFCAITLTIYGVPGVRLVIIREVTSPVVRKTVQDEEPTHWYFTRYLVMGEPPLSRGATQLTLRLLLLPLVTVNAVALSGTVIAGTTGNDGTDATLSPIAFLADTLITYAVPLVRPVTTHEVADDTRSVNVVHVEPLLLEYCTR